MQRPEIDTLSGFDALVAQTSNLEGVFVQALDLRERREQLRRSRVRGAVFLGCDLAPASAESLRARGALLFPSLPDVPLHPYRGQLYTPSELYAPLPDGSYEDSLDGRVYAWTQAQTQDQPADLEYTLATSLHDHAIGDALDDLVGQLDPRSMVGIMGGHALQRGDAGYRAAVELGASLAQDGRLVLTGGGPGAMEAANLGAYLARHSAAERDEACALLSAAPSFRDGIDPWARAAMAVLERFPDGAASLGIPTWFYGHEPPNLFATSIAKYVSNALREDVLLRLCRGGIIYLPGAAGTVQELFQAVTANYYATAPDQIAPLILAGRAQWADDLPAWPLLERLARGRAMEQRVVLVDDPREALAHLATR